MPVNIPDAVMERAGFTLIGGYKALDPRKLTRADILAIAEINPEPEAPFGGRWTEDGSLRIEGELVAYVQSDGTLVLYAGDGLAFDAAREILTAWESRPADCKTLRAAWEAREGGR